jgi:protein translocase SecG subunit
MFNIAYAIVAVLFIVSVIMQQKNSSLGSFMGQDAGDEMVQTRRGAELVLHRASILLAVLLLGGAIYSMMM